MSFISTIIYGFILLKLWLWFIVPIFELEPLRIIEAIGISSIVNFLSYKFNKDDAEIELPLAISVMLTSAVYFFLVGLSLVYLCNVNNKKKYENMRVVSFFDGMSFGQIALNDVGIIPSEYIAFEIDKYAISITKKNYPNTQHMGSVVDADLSGIGDVDLFIGGSPCQSFSVAGKGEGFDGTSKLFWEFVKAKKELNPTYWMLENVAMKKEWEQVITDALGVEPIKINSRDFGVQNRKRLFWTNIPVSEVDFTNDETLGDILTTDFSEKTVRESVRNLRHERKLTDKSLSCSATMYKGAGNNGMSLVRRPKQTELSVLNVHEVEKLMHAPKDYTEGVSNTQRYKMLGNGWDMKVISYIFNGLKPIYSTKTE